MSLKRKLTSRKFWVAICGALYIIITEGLGIDIDREVYWGVVAIIFAYIFGEAIIDLNKTKKS